MTRLIKLGLLITGLALLLSSCGGDEPTLQIADFGSFTLDGGGEEMPNQAFVDLSSETQSSVNKYAWDLGFYTAPGAHKVVVNNSAYVMAQPIDKTDLNAVVAADTLGFGADMVVSNYVNAEAANWIDDQSGDLDATAFGTISSTDSENKVFIISRPNGDWKKVRVLQDGDDYTLQYANIAATTFDEVTIKKDDNYNFIFFNLDGSEVAVEPKKDRWDLMYGTFANRANFGSLLAIGYKDYIITNRNGVEVAQVLTEEISYDEITLDDVIGLSFNSDINAIGSNWRSGGGPSGGPELFTDRFYVLKDTDGNTYKIMFTALYTLEGERGYPEFIYELITE